MSDNNNDEAAQYEYLLERENIIGVGVDDDGTLIVYVTQKVPESELPDDAIVSRNIEDDRDSDVRDADGEIELHATPRDSHRPIKAGVSEGPASQRVAGTGGPIAEVTNAENSHLAPDVSQGDQVRVSNCHVYADARATGGRYGDPITQPARLDGGSDQTVLGPLIGYRPIANEPTVDAAVRAISPHDTQGAFGLPEGYPEGIRRSYGDLVGETVTKSGRTTEVTQATVEVTGASIRVRVGPDRVETFRDQIVTTDLSEPGDSGSPVFDAAGQLLGLLFAGSDTLTVLNTIANVENVLGIRMLDEPLRPDAPEEGDDSGNSDGSDDSSDDSSGDGSDDGSDDADESEPEPGPGPTEPEPPTQTLRIGPGTNFATMEYSFAVADGAAVEFDGKSSTKVDNRVNAWCAGWTNTYEIDGEIIDASIPEGAFVELNGERVDREELVDRSHSIAAGEEAEP